MYFQTKSIRQRRLWTTGLAAACCLSLLAGAGFTAAVYAAPQETPAAPASSTVVTSSSYQIQPEDVLDISVVDHPEVNKSVPVMTDGTIDYPYVGQIRVSGMTIADLKTRLTKDLSKQFVRPQVIIQVTLRRPKTFTATGVLKSQGKHNLKEGERLLEAIADAGGLPAERAEFYTLTILRDGTTIPVDLPKLFAGDPAQNIEIKPDDIFYMVEKEAAETTVQVLGQVSKAGPVTWPRDGSIVTVLQAVGGPTDKALLSGVLIQRKGQNLPPVDLRDYQKTGFVPPVTLQPGDWLIVPENTKVYYVAGPVGQTGSRLYPDSNEKKLTVYSALVGAGGQPNSPGGLTLEGAELKKTKLVRPDPTAPGGTKTYVIDVEHMVKTGDLSQDMEVKPGDSILVPPAGGRRGVSLGELIGYLSGITTLLYFFKR